MITFVGSLKDVVGFISDNTNDGVVCSCLFKDSNYSANMSITKKPLTDLDTVVFISDICKDGILTSAEIFQFKQK